MISIQLSNVGIKDFLDTNPYYNNIINSLLRSYSGLFNNLIPINEDHLAEENNIEKKELINILSNLDKLEIINYCQKKDHQIIYTQNRIETQYLKISEKMIYEEQKRKIIQANNMIDYCVQKEKCRSNILLSYFGEEIDQYTCKKCDICIE